MTLTDQLTDMETQRSLCEDQLRELPLSAMSPFQGKGSLQAMTFKRSNQTLNETSVLETTSTVNSQAGKKIGVLFSGGPAAGGHNVIAGIAAVLGGGNTLLGIKCGPKGLLTGDIEALSAESIKHVTNLGGFDLLGSDRTKIKTKEQFDMVKKTVQEHQLDGIIVVGGDDSNTNAALLARDLKELRCTVVGVPKTIDGDLQVGSLLPISFGFDTATKIYSEMVGNILQDTPSSRKYWHFIKLMGRSASHVTLEVALQTKPALTFISEEVAQKQWRLQDIVDQIVNVVTMRAEKGMNYGVVLIPEGLIEFVPELRGLIDQLNGLLAQKGESFWQEGMATRQSQIVSQLSHDNAGLFKSLPAFIQEQLLRERDAHGNVQVSQIPTERLLIEMTEKRLSEQKRNIPFSTNAHFFGYEGRCGAPSRFDALLTYNLGIVAGALVLDERSGYMAAITNFQKGVTALGLPLEALIQKEIRDNKEVSVIKKALVELDSPAYQFFNQRRDAWSKKDDFSSPGPRQFWGPVAEQLPITVALNQGYDSLDFIF